MCSFKLEMHQNSFWSGLRNGPRWWTFRSNANSYTAIVVSWRIYICFYFCSSRAMLGVYDIIASIY